MQYGTELLVGASVIPAGQAQRLAVQTSLLQSLTALHAFPVGHFWQVAPPQSMSVSSWFFTPSVHVGISHTHGSTPLSGVAVVHVAPLKPTPHSACVQSVPVWQVLPTAHGGQAPPPQSTPVSCPFFTPSVHVEL